MHPQKRHRLLAGLLSISWALLMVTLVTQAAPTPESPGATFVVNSTLDRDDNLTNGFCEDFEGNCTLRAAIQEANAQPGPDTIVIQPGTYTLTQAGAGEDGCESGDLDISDDLLIEAQAGVFVDGGGVDRVFHVLADATVELRGFTVQNGTPPAGQEGGNIYNSGTLTLQNMTVTGGSAAMGGGVYSRGPLTVNNSHIVSNGTPDGADGASPTGSGKGGGIYAWGSPLTITLSTIALNTTGSGGSGSGTSGQSGGSGAGLYLGDNTVVTISSSDIRANVTGSGGDSDSGSGGAGGNDGGLHFRGNSLTLSGVTVRDNIAGSGGSGTTLNGGGGSCGGVGIWYARGPVTIEQSIISGNRSGDGRSGGLGGGICYIEPVSNDLLIDQSSIVDNQSGAAFSGDRDGGDGGGLLVMVASQVTLQDSRVLNNSTGAGGAGGLYYHGGHGGGIAMDGGTLTIEASTIAANTTGGGLYGGRGGGIHMGGGSVTLDSSTLSGNQAAAGSSSDGEGGGLYAVGSATISNSTVSGNHAAGNGGGLRVFSTTTLGNSILANNTTGGNGPDCAFALTSQGYNLIEDPTLCTISGDTTGNLTGVDPQLAPLQINGGPTETHALLPGSPAIDTGNPTTCPAVDQRGQPRPNAYTGVNRCDMGAFEIQGQETSTVSTLPENVATTFGATRLTMTRTLGTTDPLTTTVARLDEPPGGGTPDSGEMPVTWVITAAVDSGLDVDVAFCYGDAELGGLTEADLQAYRDGGSGWQLVGGSVDEAANCVLVDGVSAFSSWTLATSPPVEAAGGVSGSVTYVGSDPQVGAFAVGLHANPGDPPLVEVQIPTAGGPYSIGGVPDGSYYVSAYADLDGSGGPPDASDLLVFYDADGDGTPDPVTVSGAVVGDVDLWVADQFLAPTVSWQASPGGEPALRSAGDVNGDGYDDVIVGVRAAGAVYVWYGGAEGPGDAGTAGNADWTATGSSGDDFGDAVSGIGDVNGDGFDDIGVGAPGTNSDAGAVYVWYGGPAGLGDPGTVANADWTSAGGQAGDGWGVALAAAGDVDDDGNDDLLIGAPYYSDGETYEGGAFLFLGDAAGLGDPGTPANADWRATANQADAFLGTTLFGAGSVNGDTYADLLIGAPGYDDGQTDEGLLLVFHGGQAGPGDPGTPANADWWAAADADFQYWGEYLAAAGDLNGDGFDDVAVAEDAVYVWYGGSGGLGDPGTPANADWVFNAGEECRVAAGGDTDGDGYGELWVGLPGNSQGGSGAGALLLFGGGEPGLSPEPVWLTLGADVDARLGALLAPAGDVNGDGAADVMALQDNPTRLFVWYGGADLRGAAAISDSPTQLYETTTLTATHPAGTTPLVSWDFGDGATGSGAVVTYTYAVTGTYAVVVTLTNPVSVYTATTSVQVTPGYRIHLPVALRKP